MIKPWHSFLFLLSVGAVLGLLWLVFPSGKITLGSDFEIKLVTGKNIIDPNDIPKPDVTRFEAMAQALASQTDTLNLANKPVVKPDSVTSPDSLSKITRIEYTSGQGEPYPMYLFFTALDSLKKNPKASARILHIGDSQIEGDRITFFLRNRFQQMFGGKGIGLVQLVEINHLRATIDALGGKGWHKATFLDPANKKSGLYSILGSRFTPVASKADTTIPDTTLSLADTLLVRQFTYKLRRPLTDTLQLNLFAQPGKHALTCRPIINDSLMGEYTLKANFYPQMLTMPIYPKAEKITLELNLHASAAVFGIGLDKKNGLSVDNVPLRGSSGVEYLKIPDWFLYKQMELLKPSLIIYQFGVNVVPMVRDDYSYYQKLFSSTIKKLRKCAPMASFIVVGVSDMARNQNGTMESYPNIELIRDAQRAAAHENGCAFYDLYEAMGGKNSMVQWAEAQPPLAAKDYTHFSPAGAQVVAEMLFTQLIDEYSSYKQKKLP